MSAEPVADFQKNLIQTFLQEAEEWLQQIHVALDELQQGPTSDRHRTLVETIKACITTMGGSAATIGLNEVTRASFSTVPFLEAVQDPAAKLSADDFIALCKQLGGIHAALTRSTSSDFQIDGKQDPDKSVPITVQASDVLAALYRFQESRVPSDCSSRNLLRDMIEYVEGVKNSGLERCDITSLKEYLDRWSEREAGLLEIMRVRVPALVDAMRRLKCGEQGTDQAPEWLREIVEHAAQLLSSVQQVHAPQTAFFTGLHSFLTAVMQRRVAVAIPKYEAVESRLRANLQALEAWVEAGRAERSAITGIFRG